LPHAITVRGAAPTGRPATGHAALDGAVKDTAAAAPAAPEGPATKLTLPALVSAQPSAERFAALPSTAKMRGVQLAEPGAE
jgi:hypothetical protein